MITLKINRTCKLYATTLCLMSTHLNAFKFHELWKMMQYDYEKISKLEPRDTVYQENFCHPSWQERRQGIKKLIQGKPNKGLLNCHEISGSMVRREYNKFQKYEIDYITHCLSEKNKIIIENIQDTNFGNLEKIPGSLSVSSNTLGHLFYAAKILENIEYSDVHTIVEFGGGFGNLARIFKKIFPSATIVLIDLPETLVVQALFLRRTLPDSTIIVHDVLPTTLEDSIIHLIPVFFTEKLHIKADLFVSTFALSEATDYLQTMMLNNKFYNARYCYIVGQLNGWNDHKFVDHKKITSGMRTIFKSVSCIPFHHGLVSDLGSYELFATNI